MQFWQLKQRVHSSWLIAYASASFVVGVMCAQYGDGAVFSASVWPFIGTVLFVIALWRRMVIVVPLVIVAGLLIGLWRGLLTHNQLAVYDKDIGSTVTFRGVVSDDPDVGKSGETLLRLGTITVGGRDIAGAVWVSTTQKVTVQRSDVVTVTGKLSAGFGSFGASIYRAKIVKVERPEPGDVALQARDWFADNVRKTIAEPQVSLGLGYLLGLRRSLPPELDQALVVAGLTHVVVASGYNLTILVRLARRLFVKVSKYLATLSAGTMIVAFVAVTGMSPSMSRAGLVAGLSLAAWYYGRAFHPLILLPFAAAVTVAINPTYAWNDLGWQLSFAAFAGVMILAPLLQRYFFGEKEPGIIRQILGETISATIVTLPILVLAFGQFSNVAIIANIAILPLVPLAMLLTFIAGVCVMVIPATAVFVGLPAQRLLTYMTTTAEYFAGLPWAQTTVEIQPWMTWLAYAGIIGLCFYLQRATKYDLGKTNIIE